MKCPECQIELPNGFKFCKECEHALTHAAKVPTLDHCQPQSYTPKHLVDKILTRRSAIEGEEADEMCRMWI
jgi:predicted amidophosphoribosyltransferase